MSPPRPYYEDARHGITIYHGDCRDIVPSLGQFDLLCTDPPYSFGHPPRRREYSASAAVVQGLTSSAEHVQKGGAALCMTAASGRGFSMAMECLRSLAFKRLLVWNKSFVNSPVAGPWRWDVVPILAFGRVCYGRPMHSSHIETDGHRTAGITSHPAEVPIAVARWLVRPLLWKVLFDPFAGSGTFLVAARELGRHAIGIEIEERYCELAARRLEQCAILPFSAPQPEPDQPDLPHLP